MIFVCCQLCDAYPDLRLPFLAVSGKLGEEHPGTSGCMFQPLLDDKAIRRFAFLNKAIISCEDVGTERSDDVIDPH